MKPEYIEEFTLDAQTAIKHKALCVWQLLGSHYTQEELEKYCSLYAITPEQALEWKDH
jgi:hypothetical protein